MQQIAEGVYTFTGLLAGRVYALADGDGLALVDAGTSFAAPRILRQLGAAGYRPSDVRRILITHAHADHVGGLPALHAATGAPVYASLRERPVIQDGAPVRPPPPEKIHPLWRPMMRRPQTMPSTPVAHLLADGDRLDVLDGLEVIATPGHAPGHVAFWQPARRLLIAGDVMMHLFGKLRLPIGSFTSDMDENIRSLTRLAALEPETVLFGHGQPILHGAAAAVHALERRARAG